jgi:hypothetical protein
VIVRARTLQTSHRHGARGALRLLSPKGFPQLLAYCGDSSRPPPRLARVIVAGLGVSRWLPRGVDQYSFPTSSPY